MNEQRCPLQNGIVCDGDDCAWWVSGNCGIRPIALKAIRENQSAENEIINEIDHRKRFGLNKAKTPST